MNRTVIVTGGRDYADANKVFDTLNFLRPTTVIQGGAEGADALARDWAFATQTELITYKADWKTHGRQAGPMRNKRMLFENPMATVVAFKGGRGTEDCMRQAIALGFLVLEVK
jgi:hypothetical protein